MNHLLKNKIIFIFLLSFFLFSCTKGENQNNTNGEKTKILQETCKNRQRCSGLLDCNNGKDCIEDLCNNPVCISREEACKAACGYPDCLILESNPSLVKCK